MEDTDTKKFLIAQISDLYFGISISNIRDVLKQNETTPVPRSNNNIIGLLNLRGHIVTEINVAKILEVENVSSKGNKDKYSVVITKDHEMYSMVFDKIGDIVDIEGNTIEKLPETINKNWLSVAEGVVRMDEDLVVILNLESMINHITPDKDTA